MRTAYGSASIHGDVIFLASYFINNLSRDGKLILCQYPTQLTVNERFDNIRPTESRFISQLNGTMVIAQTFAEDSGTYRWVFLGFQLCKSVSLFHILSVFVSACLLRV